MTSIDGTTNPSAKTRLIAVISVRMGAIMEQKPKKECVLMIWLNLFNEYAQQMDKLTYWIALGANQAIITLQQKRLKT